jgi:hypothetical protein
VRLIVFCKTVSWKNIYWPKESRYISKAKKKKIKETIVLQAVGYSKKKAKWWCKN